ncbi:MAG: DUF190 domain-containing protein, partial [Nitrosopumilus sp.]|nr:DUF190 domain-containing protein [Nitrosopumilus sp.]
FDGSGKSKKSTLHLGGLIFNQPMMIDVVEENPKLEPLIPQTKRMMDDYGIITRHEIDAI